MKKTKVVQRQEMLELEHAQRIKQYGVKLRELVAKEGCVYFEICDFIRTNNVNPKLVSEQLGALGFHRVRISEINRVAYSSNENWSKFKASVIGFRRVLNLEREVTQRLVADTISEEMSVVAAAVKRDAVGVTIADRVETDARKVERICKVLLLIAERMNIGRKRVSLGNGYEVVIKRYGKNFRSPGGKIN